MELQIRYQANSNYAITGAYVSGSPDRWFAEIAHWAIDPLTIEAYLVPKSIADNDCGGILVVFKGQSPVQRKIRYPFTEITDGFFIPVDGRLFPDPVVNELASIKRWPVQFFHPHIGLVGFERKDAMPLSSFVEMPVSTLQNWLVDFPVAPALPQLQGIMLEQAPMGAMEALMALIGVQPLSEIPNPDDENGNSSKWSWLFKPLTTVGLWLLLIFAFIGKFILLFISLLLPKSVVGIGNKKTPGFLQQLQSWIDNKMASIEKQRDTELNRLVKMFDQNKDMALQYAIPLSNTQLNRGVASTSGKLSRRLLNFNFGHTGGGAVDAWDLGNYRLVLQQRYEKAATQAIENGDYKRAAYIYAHLLGDYFMAAKTLEDGKHYREAATVYQEHLKNKRLAAECLERGGLLNEAIALYVELENYEKAGDLYTQIGQPEKAIKYYEDVVTKCLAVQDYLNSARLIDVKIGDQERSLQVLLAGWKDNHQGEQCLKAYFDTTLSIGNPLVPAIKYIFQQHVGKAKGTSFLHVLADITTTVDDEKLKEETLSICYEIVSWQAANGNFSGLKMLNRFMPGDRLIAQDTSRYAIKNHKEIRHIKADHYIQLEPQINWKNFCSFHDQLIGVGMNDGGVQLLRMNWDGHQEYSYLFPIGAMFKCQLIGDGGISENMIMINDDIPSAIHDLPGSRFFERELQLHQLNWLSPFVLHVALNPDRHTFSGIAIDKGGEIKLNRYTFNGKQVSSYACLVGDEALTTSMLVPKDSALYLRKSHFYFTGVNTLVRTDENGLVDLLETAQPILDFSVSGVHSALKIAVLTEGGCFIVSPNLKEMFISIPLFAEALNAHLLQLLPNNQLVLASDQKAQVYDVSGKRARLLVEVITEHSIARILTLRKRNHFALLESDNRISVHVLEDL